MMRQQKRQHPPEKLKLHPRNRHRGRYEFKTLIVRCPERADCVILHSYGDESVDFSNPKAVKIMNKALLNYFYDIDFWEIPDDYLCPPIPGRADYIHYIADLLAAENDGKIPTGRQINCLDTGVGANCVYPIIGSKEYGWSFVGSDVDAVSIRSANKIIENNPRLREAVECRLQTAPQNIFRGIFRANELFDVTICNPPFHSSAAQAKAGTLQKLSNLNNRTVTKVTRNFGGQNREIWCEGGEEKFAAAMIAESVEFRNSCFWFSTLIAKQASLKNVYAALKNVKALELKTIPMGQGNKISRIVAWTFLDEEQRKSWKNTRWKSNRSK